MQHNEKRSYEKLKGGRARAYNFIALPSDIIYGNRFHISPAAKILYAAMLGRASLSERSATERNAFIDEDGYIYIYFTNAEVCEILDCGKNTATKFIKELLDSGLIERKAQGLGKAVRYYVMDFSSYAGADEECGIQPEKIQNEVEELPTEPEKAVAEPPKNDENSRSQKMGVWTPTNRDTQIPFPNFGSLESQNMGVKTPTVVGTNKKEFNKREISQSQSIPPNLPCEEQDGLTDGFSLWSFMSEKESIEAIKEQIEYEYLIDEGASRDLLDCIVSVMVETLRAGEDVKTREKVYPYRAVRRQLDSLDSSHINFVMNNFHKASDVKNPRKYILAMLLNSQFDLSFANELDISRDIPNRGIIKINQTDLQGDFTPVPEYMLG